MFYNGNNDKVYELSAVQSSSSVVLYFEMEVNTRQVFH